MFIISPLPQMWFEQQSRYPAVRWFLVFTLGALVLDVPPEERSCDRAAAPRRAAAPGAAGPPLLRAPLCFQHGTCERKAPPLLFRLCNASPWRNAPSYRPWECFEAGTRKIAAAFKVLLRVRSLLSSLRHLPSQPESLVRIMKYKGSEENSKWSKEEVIIIIFFNLVVNGAGFVQRRQPQHSLALPTPRHPSWGLQRCSKRGFRRLDRKRASRHTWTFLEEHADAHFHSSCSLQQQYRPE